MHDGGRKREFYRINILWRVKKTKIYKYEKEKTSCNKTKYIKTKNETEIVLFLKDIMQITSL